MSTIDVSRKDLACLCDAILSDYTQWMQTGPRGSEELNCRFCSGKHPINATKIVHDLDCPVLVAIDCQPRLGK